MPELPEVETVKNGIAGFIGNAKILAVHITNDNLREKIPEDITEKINGANILSYRRIGKYIVIDLNNKLSLIWHLGMSGKIKTFADLPSQKEKHDHIVIETNHGWIVYNDARRFGLFTYTPTENLQKSKYFCKMGIDPFDSELNGIYLLNKIKNKKAPIKEVLLDQSIVNGIGNIYASEILYAARISPLRPACLLNENECCKIVDCTRLILKKAIDNGGSTLHDYQKPDGSLGYFQNLHCVYKKSGQRCPDCVCNFSKTGGIQEKMLSGRSTFYCPTLQK